VGVFIFPLLAQVRTERAAALPAPNGVGPWKLSTSGPRLPTSGAMFGAFVAMGSHTGPNEDAAFSAVEDQVGRTLALQRVYYSWNEPFPDPYDYLARDDGRVLLLSWSGVGAKWADIAAGKYDALIDQRAADLKAFGAPLFFSFNHEPENDKSSGTAANFVAAWKHIHDRFVADGVTNVSYVLTLMAFTYRNGTADSWYPGASYVDLLAADGYNWNGCPGRTDPWKTFEEVFAGFHDYGVAKGKPMLVAEWASMEDPKNPSAKGNWISQAATTLKTWPEVKGVSWYNNGPPGANCTWWIDSTTRSLSSFSAMAADPYFQKVAGFTPGVKASAYASVTDAGFTKPAGGSLALGSSVQWVFHGPGTHTVTDASGMGTFDSGPRGPGSVYTVTFPDAGSFPYRCSLHTQLTGTIQIPMTVSPSSGRIGTSFRLTWAVAPPAAGSVYDVQVQRPGQSWKTLWSATASTTGAFVPDAGVGTYLFRARVLRSPGGAGSDYSPAVSVLVS
jgi:plastocyanin